jgi:hypothetical protein
VGRDFTNVKARQNVSIFEILFEFFAVVPRAFTAVASGGIENLSQFSGRLTAPYFKNSTNPNTWKRAVASGLYG